MSDLTLRNRQGYRKGAGHTKNEAGGKRSRRLPNSGVALAHGDEAVEEAHGFQQPDEQRRSNDRDDPGAGLAARGHIIALAIATPRKEPMIPTTTLARMPICAFVRMRMLASQPMTPPMMSVTIGSM